MWFENRQKVKKCFCQSAEFSKKLHFKCLFDMETLYCFEFLKGRKIALPFIFYIKIQKIFQNFFVFFLYMKYKKVAPAVDSISRLFFFHCLVILTQTSECLVSLWHSFCFPLVTQVSSSQGKGVILKASIVKTRWASYWNAVSFGVFMLLTPFSLLWRPLIYNSKLSDFK